MFIMRLDYLIISPYTALSKDVSRSRYYAELPQSNKLNHYKETAVSTSASIMNDVGTSIKFGHKKVSNKNKKSTASNNRVDTRFARIQHNVPHVAANMPITRLYVGPTRNYSDVT